MPELTPIQQRIVALLPASTIDLAEALYHRYTPAERNLVYVHVYLLRQRLRRHGNDETIVYRAGRYELGGGQDERGERRAGLDDG